jgi:hypothetical protein
VWSRLSGPLWILVLFVRLSVAQQAGPASALRPTAGNAQQAAGNNPQAEEKTGDKLTHLFDGKSLRGWRETEFAGRGEISISDERLVLGFGESLTGVTWAGDFPRTNYEVQLEAMRVDGSDFFCGMTFPVGDQPCSLIVGGWGGTVVGLSSIDNNDASENETTRFIRFEKGRWYRIRLRVTEEKIEAWIDKDRVVNVPRGDRSFSVRSEVELSRPFGFASWRTTAALRQITLQGIKAP